MIVGCAGSVLELPTDHPGVSDPVYVARRNHIADLSSNLELGARPPLVEYTQVENEVWSTVNCRLDRAARATTRSTSIDAPQPCSICRPTGCRNSPMCPTG